MINYNGITIDRENQTIRHAGNKRVFSNTCRAGVKPMGFRTWEALILGHLNRDQLFELIYSACPEGGPMAGPWVFHIRFHQWRPEFARMKLRLDKQKWSGILYYRLVPDVV